MPHFLLLFLLFFFFLPLIHVLVTILRWLL
jgi:hypothetical protein